MDFQINTKKGQVTIFIIVAIVIVIAIVALFIFREDLVKVLGKEINVQDEIQSCVEESISSAIPQIIANAADPNPQKSIRYRGVNYTYICYQENDYLPCYNTHPLMKKTITELIKEETKEEIATCFLSVLEDASAKGYTIKEGSLDYSIKLVPGSVIVTVKKDIDLTLEESSQSYNDFSFEIDSNLFELMSLTSEIVNYESQYCEFDYHNYMIIYPEYSIQRVIYDSSKIYSLEYIDSKEKIKFAVRGCVVPPGI